MISKKDIYDSIYKPAFMFQAELDKATEKLRQQGFELVATDEEYLYFKKQAVDV